MLTAGRWTDKNPIRRWTPGDEVRATSLWNRPHDPVPMTVARAETIGFATASVPFAQIYSEHATPVYRFCVSLVRNQHLAEDLCGDVFVRAMRAYERVQPPPDEVRTWLFRIARNVVIDHTRRHRLWSRIATQLRRGESGGPSVESVAVVHDDLRRAVAAVQTLKPRDRELVALRTAAGLPFASIAKITGMSEAAARVATARALTRVRELMEPTP